MSKIVKKFALDFVPVASKKDLTFAASLGPTGYYADKLRFLAEHEDQLMKIRADDKSTLLQIRAKAKKANIRLFFAKEGDSIYIKAVPIKDQERRLMLLLREPRTMMHLEAQKLEMDLKTTLQRLSINGMAELKANAWRLTPKGENALGV